MNIIKRNLEETIISVNLKEANIKKELAKNIYRAYRKNKFYIHSTIKCVYGKEELYKPFKIKFTDNYTKADTKIIRGEIIGENISKKFIEIINQY